MKNVVMITQTKQDKLIVWNLTKIVEKIEHYSLWSYELLWTLCIFRLFSRIFF